MRAKNNGKNVTVFDVAKAAGVSKSTVSLVLTQSAKVSDRARQKVLIAIKETGYVYNRDAASLRSKKSNLVAIVINDLTNPYSAQLAVGLEQKIRQMGLFSMLVNSAEDVELQDQLVSNLKEYKVAAFIICPAPGTTAQWLNELVEQGFPVVNVMREVTGARVPTVLPDNFTGTNKATQHLIKQGYKSIAFLGGKESISDYHQRLRGFTEAMALSGLNFSYDLCIESDTTRNGGRKAMADALNAAPELEAVVCFSDVVAYGAIDHLKSNNITPGKNIAIIGFDDLEDSKLMSPSLSTVHIDASQIGEAVCQILKNINEGTNNQDKIIVGVEFISRESS